MASGYPSIFLPLLLLFVATASVAQADLLGGGILGITELKVDGILYFSINPTVSVARANIYLSCDGGVTVLVRGVTDLTGAFLLDLTNINGLLNILNILLDSKCAVYASVDVSAPLYFSVIASANISVLGSLGICHLTEPFLPAV